MKNYVIIAHWRGFIMGALKSFSDISNVSVISVLSSIDPLFSNPLWHILDSCYDDWFSIEA